MSDRRKKIKLALKCCRRGGSCERCPLQEEICDKLYVDMEDVPAELLDMIADELDDDK